MIDYLFQIALSNACISLALAIMAAIVGFTLKRPVITHLLWLLVFVKLLIPPFIPFSTIPVPLIIKAAPEVNLNVNEHQEILFPDVNESGDITYSFNETKSTVFNHGKQLLFFVWLSGSMGILIWSISHACRFHKLLKKESVIAPLGIQSIAVKAASCLGLKTAPIIRITPANISPMVWWTGGKVWLAIPSTLSDQMDAEQLCLILSHELAHISRWDYLCRWVEWMACVCFWWNPVVWWARHNLRVHEEICCDELVLSRMNPEPYIYGDTLLKAIDILLSTPRFQMVMASNFNGGDLLKRRLKLIISNGQTRRKLRWLNACILMAAVVLLPLGLMQAKDNDKNDLEDQLIAIEKQLDIANEQLHDELFKKEAFINAKNQFQKNMLTNPAFKQSIKNSLIQSIDRDYALLYERLDLSPDELDEFKSIVTDWRMANVERATLINAASSAEEKEEAYRQRQEARDKYNNEFLDLMGEEKFRIYDDFKNRNSERYMLNNFMETLSPENRINENQAENLIDAMYEARKSVEIEMGFGDTIEFPSDMNEEAVAQEIEMVRQVYGKYAEIGSAIIPPAQAEQYKEYLNQSLNRDESRLKMLLFTHSDN